jgi:hypothetical protein
MCVNDHFTIRHNYPVELSSSIVMGLYLGGIRFESRQTTAIRTVCQSTRFSCKLTQGMSGKAILADLQGCKTSKLQHVLDNELIDSGEVVSLTRRPAFTAHKDSCYSFLPDAESIPRT